jgi:hypothetical protein
MPLRLQRNALLADHGNGEGIAGWFCNGSCEFYQPRHGLLGDGAARVTDVQCGGRRVYSGGVCVGVFLATGTAVGDLPTHQWECGDVEKVSCLPGTFVHSFDLLGYLMANEMLQILLVLIRVEPYFLIAFVVLYGLVNVHFAQPEFGLTMALVPALGIQVALTVVFTRSENVLGTLAALVSPSSYLLLGMPVTNMPSSGPPRRRNSISRYPNPPSEGDRIFLQDLAQGRNAALWIYIAGTGFVGVHHGDCVCFQL